MFSIVSVLHSKYIKNFHPHSTHALTEVPEQLLATVLLRNIMYKKLAPPTKYCNACCFPFLNPTRARCERCGAIWPSTAFPIPQRIPNPSPNPGLSYGALDTRGPVKYCQQCCFSVPLGVPKCGRCGHNCPEPPPAPRQENSGAKQ